MLALSTQGTISENTFSFYFQKAGQDSFIDIGSPQLSLLRRGEDLVWINCLDDFFWSAYNQGVGIGSTQDFDTFAYHTVTNEQTGEDYRTI